MTPERIHYLSIKADELAAKLGWIAEQRKRDEIDHDDLEAAVDLVVELHTGCEQIVQDVLEQAEDAA